MIDPVDDTHRRTVNTQTIIQESRHRLARKIFHGKRGALYQKYREGQNQLGALGIVLNAATLWNTRYLHAIVQQLRAQGHPVLDEDTARLSPLGHAHLNELGCYRFPVLGPRISRDQGSLAAGYVCLSGRSHPRRSQEGALMSGWGGGCGYAVWGGHRGVAAWCWRGVS